MWTPLQTTKSSSEKHQDFNSPTSSMDKQIELPIKENALTPLDKSVLITLVLGRAFLENLKVLTHELKHSGDKQLIKLAKDKHKIALRLHTDVHAMFTNADKFLNPKEIARLTQSVENMTDALW
jgi:hypothetical protein